MRVLAINNNILNFSGLYVKNKNPNAPIKEKSPKNEELRANPADIFIAYKTKTPSEVKTSIKDFLAANERGVDFHINMLSSIQAGFEAAHKTTGEIYSNDDYIKTLIEQFNPKNVISFFEQGCEFDLDGNLKKKITKNKDGSIQIDYFSPDGKIERTTKTDRRGEWLEVVEGLETEKDGTQKIQKKYLFNLYENRLESYEEGIEISPLGDVKIQKEVNSKGVFSKSGIYFTVDEGVEISKDGTKTTAKSLYYKTKERKDENGILIPSDITFVYKEGLVQKTDGSEEAAKSLVYKSINSKVFGNYKEGEKAFQNGTFTIQKEASFNDDYNFEFYKEGIEKLPNGAETTSRQITYKNGTPETYAIGAEFFPDGSEKQKCALSFILGEIVYFEDCTKNGEGKIQAAAKILQNTKQGWKNVSDVLI